jgi:hypothetical protein
MCVLGYGGPTFISRIITGDESWIYSYGYDPETKQQSSQWKSPQSPKAKKKARQVRSSTKSMLIVFFSMWRGLFIVNLLLLTLWPTVTFWDAWGKICNEKYGNFGAITTGSFITTTHPNICPWKPQSLWLITWLSFPIPPTYLPTYLPTGLSPCDYALFPNLKMKLKGLRFETLSDIQGESQAVLNSIKENYLHSAFVRVRKTMGLLYTFQRTLFWRRWQPKFSKPALLFWLSPWTFRYTSYCNWTFIPKCNCTQHSNIEDNMTMRMFSA